MDRREFICATAATALATALTVIIAIGAPAAFAAKRATSSIPIVFSGAGDAAGTGLIASLARPGGYVTGMSDPSGELSAKRLELLQGNRRAGDPRCRHLECG